MPTREPKRVVEPGGKAGGTVQAGAGQSALDGFGLATTLANVARQTRYASAQASELIADTAVPFAQITPRHQQMALVRRDRPAIRHVSSELHEKRFA
jgi:hypothetical protein